MQKRSFVALLVLMFTLSIGQFAFAESVQWQTVIPGTVSWSRHDNGATYGVGFKNPNVSISYNVRVVNDATGAIVSCGSSVAQGTKLRFEFVPHLYTDINWFATGFHNDSPYGDWVAGAVEPATAQCLDKDYVDHVDGVSNSIFSPFEVDPPQKTMTGIDGFVCTSSGVNAICTASSAGSFSPVFHFAATHGLFYLQGTGPYFKEQGASYWGSRRSSRSSAPTQCFDITQNSSTIGQINVPAQNITCPITVTSNGNTTSQPGSAPGAPEVTVASGVQCTLGNAFSISFKATDPQGDRITYGIDWDNNGTMDQMMPPVGFVPSGTVQTASRIYSLPGAKTVSVRAIDEFGNASPGVTQTFNCGVAADAVASLGGDGADAGGQAPAAAQDLTPGLDITAIPRLVHVGASSQVTWSARNVTSCTVQGTNGDFWSSDTLPISGSEASSPIAAQTIYTLTCRAQAGQTLSKSVTVDIVPSWQEF